MKVIIKDPKVRIELIDILDRYNRLPYKYQSKIGYHTLVHKVILEELVNIMGTTLTDLDKELKMKISRMKYLDSKTNSQIFKWVW